MGPENNSNRADRIGFVMLFMAMAVGGAGSAFDIPLVVKITEFYDITDSGFGLLLGLTTLVMAAASAPWGYWADRHQRVRLLAAAMGVIVACILFAGLCFQLDLPYEAYFAAKLLSGIGFAGIVPLAVSMTMDTVPLPQRAAALGWMGVAFGGGGACAMLMTSICMQMNLSLGATYLLVTAAGVFFLLALLAMKEPRRGAHDEALRDTVGAGVGEYCHHIELAEVKALLTRPINLLLGAAMVFFQFPPSVLTIWFVTYLMRNHGLGELPATMLTLVAFSGQAAGNVLGGVIADRAYQAKATGRVGVMILMAALAPLFIVLAFSLPFKLLWFVPLMIVANFFIIAGGPAFAAVSLEVNLPEHRGTISAYLSICTSVALGFAWLVPPFIAKAMDGQYHLALITSAAAYAPLIAAYFLMKARVAPDLGRVTAILSERARQIQGPCPAGPEGKPHDQTP